MRFTLHFLTAILTTVSLAGWAGASPVTITVDNFNNPNPFQNSQLNGGLLDDDQATYSLTTTTRSIKFSPGLDVADTAIVGTVPPGPTGGPQFRVNSDTGFSTNLAFLFANPQNMTGLTEVSITLARLDPGTLGTINFSDLPILITLEDEDGFTSTLATTLSTTGTINFNYGLFTNSANFDINKISSLSILFNSGTLQPGADFTLTNVSVAGDGGGGIFGDPVPEPASIAVFGVLALGGVAVARRKLLARRTAAAA